MRIYERKNILERNINYSNAYGRNLLQEAIVSCENAIAIDLVNKGIDIDHQDKMGWTPLHFCAQYNNITIAELLLQEGAKVNIIDCYGNNPLWYAVFNANDDYCLVKLLVKYGADALSTSVRDNELYLKALLMFLYKGHRGLATIYISWMVAETKSSCKICNVRKD